MANAIPQDIIDSIIEAIGDDRVLKQCALVSSSFLLPSRRRLFSKISLRSDQACQRLHQLLIDNPVIQSFVRSIIMGWTHKMSESWHLIAVLRLPFCRLEGFSMLCLTMYPSDWSRFSSELRDALSSILHSSTLKTLYICQINAPIILFQGMHLTKLVLHSFMPNDFDGDSEQSRLLRPAALEGLETSHTVIDQCVWRLNDPVLVPTEPIFLPFMCRLRVFEIDVHQSSTSSNFDIVFFLMRSLCISLTSPATLEHLKLSIEFEEWDINLPDADVWRHLDSIVTHPTGMRLQRVDIDIKYNNKPIFTEPILNALPLLQEKGILFVKASVRGWNSI